MRISKYINLDTNILMEYIYDDSNLISEPYEILVNIKEKSKSYMSDSTSVSLNTIDNQLFEIDPISRTFGKVGSFDNNVTTNYPFLQVNNYASGYPLRYDTIVIRLPINYTFGEHIGFYLKGYSFDFQNNNTYNLCNFYFDITDYNTKGLINYTNPPILYQEALWGKEITILIPSLYEISGQRKNNIVTSNSVNYNLTGGIGMSQQSPLFFEFSFINITQTINNVKTYNLGPKILTNITQTPDFQQLGVMIQHSINGDFFEIYGIFNNTIADFNTWMNNSVYLGNNYFVNFTVTTYEQNIRGESVTFTLTTNFNNPIPYRPIIKYSSTTAVIDVVMNIIDAVDGSSIIRRASYGMLQDEVSKYGLNLTKINLLNATKPKIYNKKSSIGSSSIQVSTINNVETVSVPFAVLMDRANVIAKSDNVVVGNTLYYGDGKLKILIKPFDNIIKFTIALEVLIKNGAKSPNYLDLTGYGLIKLVFKNTQNTSEFALYTNNSDVNLSNGTLVFLIPSNKINEIRTIYNSGINVFYITGTQQNITSVIYSGMFDLYDSITNLNNLSTTAVAQLNANSTTTNNVAPIINANNSTSTNTTNSTTGKIITRYVNVANTTITNNNGILGSANNSNSNGNTQNVEKPTINGPRISTVDQQVTYTTSIGGGIWSSGDRFIASIDSSNNTNATVTMQSSGNTTITYTAPNGISNTINLVVYPVNSGGSSGTKKVNTPSTI